jgi:hypothetical protein
MFVWTTDTVVLSDGSNGARVRIEPRKASFCHSSTSSATTSNASMMLGWCTRESTAAEKPLERRYPSHRVGNAECHTVETFAESESLDES